MAAIGYQLTQAQSVWVIHRRNSKITANHENIAPRRERHEIKNESSLFVFSILRAFVMKIFLGSRLMSPDSSLLGGYKSTVG